MDYQETEHPDILKLEEEIPLQGDQLQAALGEFLRLSLEGDDQALIGLLGERVPGSMIRETPPPDFTSVI
jgi:hypothetical protein